MIVHYLPILFDKRIELDPSLRILDFSCPASTKPSVFEDSNDLASTSNEFLALSHF